MENLENLSLARDEIVHYGDTVVKSRESSKNLGTN